MSDRSEADRLVRESGLQRLLRRPEVGAFSVMLVIVVALAIASDFKAFNPLGLKNNIAIVAQYGIIATGAAALMIAGEFDLSIGSMIGFTGMIMAMVLKYGFLPLGIPPGLPVAAFLIALTAALFLGWVIGTIVVRSGLSSFIVTLAFLFFLRGATEASYRLINQSTQISGLQDFKDTLWFANILGGDERVVDGELQPVTDEDITPLIAASIIKGTEYKGNDIDESKIDDLTMTIATKAEADGGLGMDEETASTVINDGQLMLADVRGLSLQVVAKPNGKGNFVNLYWAPAE